MTRFVRERPYTSLTDMPHLEEGLRGLEETRRIDLEQWLDRLGLDAAVFPAVADIGRADMDVSTASADLGGRNGVWVANGNLVPRHLGIPTVTVPMGTMHDTGRPSDSPWPAALTTTTPSWYWPRLSRRPATGPRCRPVLRDSRLSDLTSGTP
ncbi:hypothetical protein ACIQVR_41505 [Streptomyces xanthochromogenes]|uniref:hypothetical protein n=1 Tax=Streptomyces xanthochromogenes TaxID=67384 RepID=UPI00380BF3FF